MSQDFWNQFYIDKGRFFMQPHEAFNKVVRLFKEYKIKNILDLGSGSGRHIVHFAEKNFDVTGIDFSPAAIDLAQKWILAKNLKSRAYIADFHDEINFINEASFDAVIAVDSLQFNSLSNLEKTITEINRVLRTGGLFFTVLPTKETKIRIDNLEQLIFDENRVKDLFEQKFRIIELSRDSNHNLILIGQEK